MAVFAGASINEVRILTDPSDPSGSTYQVILPITVLEAVIDPVTGKNLAELLTTIGPEIYDNLTSTSVVAALSANQGRVLNGLITALGDKFNQLTGFNIEGVVDTYADSSGSNTTLMGVDTSSMPNYTLYMVRNDETRSNATTVYQWLNGEWVYMSEFILSLDNYPTFDQMNAAIAAAILSIDLTYLDAPVSSRADAATALSNAIWTAARAASLDRLDANISSRAPANTALNNNTWTDTLAASLRQSTDILIYSGTGMRRWQQWIPGTYYWTVPANLAIAETIDGVGFGTIYTTACGGGGGGSSQGGTTGGRGGGGADCVIGHALNVIPGEELTIIIGEGGRAGMPGTAGSATTITTIRNGVEVGLLTLLGGGGGGAMSGTTYTPTGGGAAGGPGGGAGATSTSPAGPGLGGAGGAGITPGTATNTPSRGGAGGGSYGGGASAPSTGQSSSASAGGAGTGLGRGGTVGGTGGTGGGGAGGTSNGHGGDGVMIIDW